MVKENASVTTGLLLNAYLKDSIVASNVAATFVGINGQFLDTSRKIMQS